MSLLRTLCELIPLAPVFGCSWSLSSCCSLERVCASGLWSPSFPFAYNYVPYWCSLCSSALLHSCRMASPFSFETGSHFHDVLHVGCLPYFSFLRSVFPYQTQCCTQLIMKVVLVSRYSVMFLCTDDFMWHTDGASGRCYVPYLWYRCHL